MESGLAARADYLNACAQKIMKELRLLEILEQAGRPVLVGSVRFGLLVSPNIDFEVYSKTPDVAQAFEIMGRLAENRLVSSVKFYNFLETGDPGLYFKVDLFDVDGRAWDIDIWFVPESHPYAGLADRFAKTIEKVLTEESRSIILDIKSRKPQGSQVRGIHIYRAVLRDGVKSPEEFESWLLKNSPTDAIDPWVP